jgi:hypothetical protein
MLQASGKKPENAAALIMETFVASAVNRFFCSCQSQKNFKESNKTPLV